MTPKRTAAKEGVVVMRLKRSLPPEALQQKVVELNNQLLALQRELGFTHIIPKSTIEGDEVVIEIIPAKVVGKPQKKPGGGWGAAKK